MSKKGRKQKVRAEPMHTQEQRNMVSLCNLDVWEDIICSGYTPLSQNPEIVAAVNKIASIVSSMTIHLMENTDNGDIRLKDELAKKIDINPNPYMTRKTFISYITRNLLLEGDGNSVVYPKTKNGLIDELIPLPANSVSFVPDGFGYKIVYNGIYYDPSEFIHVVINPSGSYPWKGNGYRVALKDIAKNLAQANETVRGFMQSKWKPSVIVKVDGMVDEFASKDGRTKLLNKYIESNEAGEPWMIPAEGFDVVTVKPLSLTDLAINENVTLDKKTVAAILDVPPFVLGIGDFNADVWNNWINTRIKDICGAIEQELTRNLLISPTRYFKFNCRSLMAYDIEKLSRVGCDNYTRGIMKGNEVRDWLNLPPEDGLDELVILENYIPVGMIGDQKKLIQGGDDNG